MLIHAIDLGTQIAGSVPRERHSFEWRCRRQGKEIDVPGDPLHRQRLLGIISFP
jgi:hypothetical protein